MQRRLCRYFGAATTPDTQMLSFTQLANNSFTRLGGAAVSLLDTGSRFLLMRKALLSVQETLLVYRNISNQPGFVDQLLTTSASLKCSRLSPQDLLSYEKTPDHEPQLAAKLSDLYQILTAYDALAQEDGISVDPNDRLNRLADALVGNPTCYADYDIYLTCFDAFTPQELAVIALLAQQAASVTVALVCEDGQGRSANLSFSAAKHTRRQLAQLAEITHYGAADTRQRSLPLSRLTGIWCGATEEPKEAFAENTDAIALFSGENAFEQVEFVAGKLIALTQTTDLRWRDIGIALRNPDSWVDTIRNVFQFYAIPVNLGEETASPLIKLVEDALAAVLNHYAIEDMFRFLKNGLLQVDGDLLAHMENYALVWNIRGNMWLEEGAWRRHPEGPGKALQGDALLRMQAIDALRKKIIAPLEALRTASAQTGKDWSMCLYQFVSTLQDENLLRTDGEAEATEAIRADWDFICHCMERSARHLGDEPSSLPAYSRVLSRLFGERRRSAAGNTQDQVCVAEAGDMVHRDVKCLVLLGAEDTAFPQIAALKGLLNDRDKEVLAKAGIVNYPTPEHCAMQEMALLYRLVALPTEKLILCHGAFGEEGSAQQPCALYMQADRLFPNCRRYTSEDILRLRRYLPTNAPREMPDAQQDRLSSEMTERLYHGKVALSASRIDRLMGCRFRDFMDRGLKAKEREKVSFEAKEVGTFVHYALEQSLRYAKENGGVQNTPAEEIRFEAHRAASEYAQRLRANGTSSTARIAQIIRRLDSELDEIVKNVVDELHQSDFEPTDFELAFGMGRGIQCEMDMDGIRFSFNGMVDRLDTWTDESDGTQYFRVVDYKSGGKKLQFRKLLEGLDLQMLIYLFILRQVGGAALLPDAIPAGVLYVPAKDVLVKEDDPPKQGTPQEKKNKKLVRSGLILDTDSVKTAMERGEPKSWAFLPGDEASRVTPEQLKLLERHVNAIYEKIAANFRAGNVQPEPFYISDHDNACGYCPYTAACYFRDGENGQKYRYLSDIHPEDFWEELKNRYHA